jgi:predicted phage tail protein
MKKPLVDIKLHGVLGESVGSVWSLAVNSVSEAMRGIEVLSRHKLYKFLIENDKKGTRYRVLINGRDFESPEPLDVNRLSTIRDSELCMLNENLKSIDIVPILEGSGDDFLGVLQVILGVILVIVGIALSWTGIGVAIIIAGIGLIASGIMSILTQRPDLEPYQTRQKTSYLFSGPANVVDEGIPVPVPYGRLLIGSIVMSADYELYNYYTGEKPGEKKGGTGSSPIGGTAPRIHQIN